MPEAFACVLYPTAAVSDRALSRGFAVALAGFELASPSVTTAELSGLPGWSVAFYRSGLKLPRFEEHDHACDLFEEELPPGLAVRDAAQPGVAEVYALVYSDEVTHDDAWRFGERALERHFVREGEDGLEVGVETLDTSSVELLELSPTASEAEEQAQLRPHRGTTFLSAALGAPVLPALVAAAFGADHRIPVRLVEPDPASIRAETQALNRVLKRVDGRGTGAFPSPLGGVSQPAQHAAFAAVYDFADPGDPSDLYRELSCGRVEGTLRFHRPADLEQPEAGAARAALAAAAAYPVATLSPSALGGGSAKVRRQLGLCADGQRLILASPDGTTVEAGPTFGELLLYLSLGFKRRDDVEEDVIGAVMLKAKLRAG